MSLLLIPIMLLAFFFTIFYLANPTKHRISPRRVRKVDAARAFLRDSALESRAKPNKRLVDTFSINNAFTTIDPIWHREFVTKAKDLIRTPETEWLSLVRFALEIVHAGLRKTTTVPGDGTLPLVNFVQSLVFRIVVIKFFPGSSTPSPEDVEFISKAINDLWISSKEDQDSLTEKKILENIKAKQELNSRLDFFILPHQHSQHASASTGYETKKNPLNWILPAYEMLWRVVLHCFLEIKFRSTLRERYQYEALMERFSCNPCLETFEKFLHPDTVTGTGPELGASMGGMTKEEFKKMFVEEVILGVSLAKTIQESPRIPAVTVKDIINETLRLYPPTRRINRYYTSDPQRISPRTIAIDVEYLHHDRRIWGEDALLFRPARWAEMDADNERWKAFMPFGDGKFVCPAKNTFGPWVIALLVGSLVREMKGWEVALDDENKEKEERVLGKEGSLLESRREAFPGLRLRLFQR